MVTTLIEPVDELTRRGLLAGGLSLAALLAGGGAAAAATAGAEFPRTVQTAHGPIRIPTQHDLKQACRYAHHLIALRDGAVVACGRPGDVVTAELVEDVFGLAVRVIPDPESGTSLVIPRARAVPHPSTPVPRWPATAAAHPACWRKHDQSHPGTNRRKAACQRPHRRAPRHRPGAHGDGVRR